MGVTEVQERRPASELRWGQNGCVGREKGNKEVNDVLATELADGHCLDVLTRGQRGSWRF